MENFNILDNSPYIKFSFPGSDEEHLLRSSFFKESKLISRLLEESADNKITLKEIDPNLFSALVDYKMGITPSIEQLPLILNAAKLLECKSTEKKLKELAKERFTLQPDLP